LELFAGIPGNDELSERQSGIAKQLESRKIYNERMAGYKEKHCAFSILNACLDLDEVSRVYM